MSHSRLHGGPDLTAERDSFRSQRGFILSCIGSAVGMGNIWLFPTRISAYGGATFLVPYLIFTVLIASTGVIEEMAFGRATRRGPIGAFETATQARLGSKRAGRIAGIIPVANSLAMAIGYSVVVGWILTYTVLAFTGQLTQQTDANAFAACFEGIAAGNSLPQIVALVIAGAILILGVAGGIERANKIMMPLFFALFVGLALYVSTLPGAQTGYAYLFVLDPQGLADPLVWTFALGQAFFSLSIAGCGTLIYGSYLPDDHNIPFSAAMVAFFDCLAAILASLVIIPAMASAGQQLSSGGPGLLFIYLPAVLASLPGGAVFMAVFFIAVLFGGMTSLINLFEAPIATLQEWLGMSRAKATIAIIAIGIVVSLAIAPIVSDWMDWCSIYGCPIGAFLAAFMFTWMLGRERCEEAVGKGRPRPIGRWFFPLVKYVFCGVVLFVLVAGILLGGIG
ncbi:MAG: sodium-dependent transporter [Eggerthellaceae bacterium]|jgi:NSS family neurotransmitter:Na+ symporter